MVLGSQLCDICDITGHQTFVTLQVTKYIYVVWAQLTVSFLSSQCDSVGADMIFLKSIILSFCLLAQTLATTDTEEMEEVLYKDANTVETFMRTREFKVRTTVDPADSDEFSKKLFCFCLKIKFLT